MLEALDLECTRGERVLFRGLGLRVEPGTLLRVAGPNGTGKTSLLRMLCGLLQPTHGEIRWRATSIRALKEEYWSALAYVGHLNGVKDDLTAVENLRASAGIAGLDADEGALRGALDAVGLAGFEDSLARFLSQGQRRRIALARLFLSARRAVVDPRRAFHRARCARRRVLERARRAPPRRRRHRRPDDAPGGAGGGGGAPQTVELGGGTGAPC